MLSDASDKARTRLARAAFPCQLTLIGMNTSSLLRIELPASIS
ncbi:MAG: hypothetical protein QOG10_6357 [Kribbellaceae bacterium]|nr:hypothetical protein [Kribbellaceae bacterium]